MRSRANEVARLISETFDLSYVGQSTSGEHLDLEARSETAAGDLCLGNRLDYVVDVDRLATGV
jgi:hypothetical protein